MWGVWLPQRWLHSQWSQGHTPKEMQVGRVVFGEWQGFGKEMRPDHRCVCSQIYLRKGMEAEVLRLPSLTVTPALCVPVLGADRVEVPDRKALVPGASPSPCYALFPWGPAPVHTGV